jgi:hypothetical protein
MVPLRWGSLGPVGLHIGMPISFILVSLVSSVSQDPSLQSLPAVLPIGTGVVLSISTE